MDPTEPAAGPTFADLGLRAELSALSSLGYEEPTPIQREAIPPLLAGSRPARPGGHRHRQDRRLRPADPRARRRPPATGGAHRPGPGPHPRAGHAGLRGHPPLRPGPRRPGAADLRRPADRPPAPGPAAGRRRRRRHPRPGRRPHQPRHASTSTPSRSSCSTRPTRCSTWASPRTSRPSSTRPPTTRQTVLFSATMPPRIDGMARRHLNDPVRITIGREQAADAASRPSGPPDRLRRARARTSPPPSAASSTSRHRPRPSSSAAPGHEVDQLTETLNGRGYRAEALHGGMNQEAARPGHGPGPRRHRRPARRHRRGRPRARHRPAHPRRQLRRALRPRGLRPPHRPGRPGRPRGRGHHPRRAARAPAAREHRAGRPGRRSPSRRCRPSPTCATGGWS